MSHFLDRLTFFTRVVDRSPDGHSITTREDRRWEDGYRKRWQHDKIVRSTHGANSLHFTSGREMVNKRHNIKSGNANTDYLSIHH